METVRVFLKLHQVGCWSSVVNMWVKFQNVTKLHQVEFGEVLYSIDGFMWTGRVLLKLHQVTCW